MHEDSRQKPVVRDEREYAHATHNSMTIVEIWQLYHIFMVATCTTPCDQRHICKVGILRSHLRKHGRCIKQSMNWVPPNQTAKCDHLGRTKTAYPQNFPEHFLLSHINFGDHWWYHVLPIINPIRVLEDAIFCFGALTINQLRARVHCSNYPPSNLKR